MGRFSCAEYENMLDIAVMLLENPETGPQMTPVLDGLCTALGGFGCILTEGIPRVRQTLIAATAEVTRIPIDELNRHLPPHPLMVHYAASEDVRARSVDDIASSGWRRTPTYIVIRDLLGISSRQRMRQFALPLHAPPGTARAFVAYRAGSEFNDRERAFAQRLQPVLQRIDCHLQILERYRVGRSTDAVAHVTADFGITARELTVLILLGDGLTAAAIGRRLGITLSTANTHLEHLYRKLATNDRLTAVLVAREHGLIPARTVRKSVGG